MTIPSIDLERLFDDLTRRHDEVTTLAAACSSEDLVTGLDELGVKLVVLHEELRVQQEELLDARRRLLAQAADSEFLDTVVPKVRTDQHGRVLGVNAAAARVARWWFTAPGYRPIASWFLLADRRAVRDMVSDVRQGRRVQGRTLRLAGPRNAPTVEVDVTVVDQSASGHGVVLSWELDGARRAQTVAPEEPHVDLVAEDLAGLALELAGASLLPEVLRRATRDVVGLVPGAESAALAVLHHDRVEIFAATDDATSSLQAQLFSEGGMGSAALASTGSIVYATDLPDQSPGSTDGRQVATTRLGSGVAVCVELPISRRVLVLSWFAARPAAFDGVGAPGGVSRAVLLTASHASVALDRALGEDNLRQAIESHERIGQAVGVVAVQAGISPDQAFEWLVTRSQHENRKLRDVAQGVLDEVWPQS